VDDTSLAGFPIGPTVSALSPAARGQHSAKVTVTLTGTGFESGASVSISGRGVTLSAPTVTSSTSLTVTVAVTAGAKLGARDVTVTNPDGAVVSCGGCFTVTPAPTLASVSPSSVAPGAKNFSLTLTGTGDQAGAKVTVGGGGVRVVSATVISSLQIDVTITVATSAPAGLRTVTIKNPDGGTVKAAVLTVT